MKWWKRILATAIPVALGVGVLAIPAVASAGVVYNTTASPCLRMHSGPDSATFVQGCLGYNTRIDIVCQLRNVLSPTANINGSTIWDQIDWEFQDGVVPGFFVSDYYTTTPVFNGFTPGIPVCSGSN